MEHHLDMHEWTINDVTPVLKQLIETDHNTLLQYWIEPLVYRNALLNIFLTVIIIGYFIWICCIYTVLLAKDLK